MRTLSLSLCSILVAAAAYAVPSLVKPVTKNVTMVYDDAGNWCGDQSIDITHQRGSAYLAKKILDLSDVPQALWDRVKTVRLSMYLMTRDYSWHDLPKANGYDEAIEVLVNGKAHVYPDAETSHYKEPATANMGWFDVVIPKSELVRGPNVIIVHKAPGKIGNPKARPDDYLYLGLDTTRRRGNSEVAFDGKTWRHDELNIPGGNGEYMIRLYLFTGGTGVKASWRPGRTPQFDDPAKLLLYAGARGLKPSPAGLRLPAGQAARVEWSPAAFDPLEPLQVAVAAQGAVKVQWLDAAGQAAARPAIRGLSGTLPASRRFDPSGVLVTAQGRPATLTAVTVTGSQSYHPQKPPVNMVPIIATPPQVTPVKLSCRISPATITLRGGYMQAVFARGQKLQLRSLRNLISKSEMLRARPDQVPLFLVEVNGRRYSGSRDFKLADLQPTTEGFVATLQGPLPGSGVPAPAVKGAPAGQTAPKTPAKSPVLQATLTVSMTRDGLHMGMNLTNIGAAPVNFKLAFPVISGLAISPRPQDDYYFFPSGGGIFNTVPAIIRRGYGDYEAMYQVMDLFSPALGCGLSIRGLDDQGWHKVLDLRKYIPGEAEVNYDRLSLRVKPEYLWQDPLAPIAGTSFAFDYLRRTRAPQSQAVPATPGNAATLQKTASFAPSDIVLTVHPGDWHVPMQTYADWAHRVWKFRPFPSRLETVRDIECPGWGHNMLFRDGKYRTDFIKPNTNCVELMSWWDWSPLGPFMTPLDKLDTILTPAQIKRLQPYIVKDPVTGKEMWDNQPGDYKTYNARFGGLPAFRKAIQTYQKMGALVTLYIDPFRLDENCDTGRAHGKEWDVILPDGKLSTGYDVYNPCYQLAAVREWLTQTVGRVMRETGADGLRLDECGYRGWACYSDKHIHTYQEPGITQWNKAMAATCKMVHAAMDKVRPGLVLMTEHPGYDYLMQYLEGCITYDLSVQKSSLRPLECNLQRFYFPECKPYELDHTGADPLNRKKFWNAEESFERPFSPLMYNILNENEDVYQGRDSTPLVPTLQPLLYANRFRGAGKTMYHLYNAMGHTFEGEALRVGADVPQAHHVIELLHGEELPVVDGKVSLYLDRNDVACVAVLPRILTMNAQGQVQIKDGRGGQLVVANDQGENVLTQNVTGSTAQLDLSKLPAGAKPMCLKLLRNKQMVDTVQWPKG